MKIYDMFKTFAKIKVKSLQLEAISSGI